MRFDRLTSQSLEPEHNKEPEMKAHVAFNKKAGPVSMSKRQAGYTLVSTVVSFTIGSIILAGAWTAYRDIQVQMHVQNADRQMDQYAQAAIQEITNFASWSWLGKQVQGGSRYTKWNFQTYDEVREYGAWVPWYIRDQDNYTQVSYKPTSGLLFGNRIPSWEQDRNGAYYVWTGRAPRVGEIRVMDRRDRMTMESLLMDYTQSNYPASRDEYVNHMGTFDVAITLHYRYRANSMFGMYSREYARERTYQTTIYQRNWDSDINLDRAEWVKSQLVPGGGS